MVFLWIAGYGLIDTVARRICQKDGVHSAVMLGYILALILWIVCTGQARQLGLCVLPGKDFVRFWPLLMLPVCNLITGGGRLVPLPVIVRMLSVCAAEELFFRGFLLRFLTKYGKFPAVFLSSVAFALFHLVNFSVGNGLYTLMQVLCAMTVGICFAAATLRTASLLPGYVAHFLTNITATESGHPSMLLWACIVLYGCYGFGFYYTDKRRERYESVH